MKIERAFAPVAITLETQEQLDCFLNLISTGSDFSRKQDEIDLAHNILTELS